MMKKKTFFIINICVVLLFAIYLVTALFIDYPKYVKIIILSVYFSYAVMRAIYFITSTSTGDGSASTGDGSVC